MISLTAGLTPVPRSPGSPIQHGHGEQDILGFTLCLSKDESRHLHCSNLDDDYHSAREYLTQIHY